MYKHIYVCMCVRMHACIDMAVLCVYTCMCMSVCSRLVLTVHYLCVCMHVNLASWVVLEGKNLPANAEDIRDLDLIPGSGRSLEEGMAIHSNILIWRISWIEESGRLQSIGSQRAGHN